MELISIVDIYKFTETQKCNVRELYSHFLRGPYSISYLQYSIYLRGKKNNIHTLATNIHINCCVHTRVSTSNMHIAKTKIHTLSLAINITINVFMNKRIYITDIQVLAKTKTAIPHRLLFP